jgi:hypothetical protein
VPSPCARHPSVDPAGLAGERRQALHAHSVGDPHVPAGQLELVVDEAGAAHRLDRREDRTSAAETVGEVGKPVAIGRAGADIDPLAGGEEGVPVEPLAAEVESDVQHCWPPFQGIHRSLSGGPEALLHRIHYE